MSFPPPGTDGDFMQPGGGHDLEFQGSISGDRNNGPFGPIVSRSVYGFGYSMFLSDGNSTTPYLYFIDESNYWNSVDPNTNVPATNYQYQQFQGGTVYQQAWFDTHGNAPAYSNVADLVGIHQTPVLAFIAAFNLNQVAWGTQKFSYQHRLCSRADGLRFDDTPPPNNNYAAGEGFIPPDFQYFGQLVNNNILTPQSLNASTTQTGATWIRVYSQFPATEFELFSAYDNTMTGPWTTPDLSFNSFAGFAATSAGGGIVSNNFQAKRTELLFLGNYTWTIKVLNYITGAQTGILSNGTAKYGDVVKIPVPAVGFSNTLFATPA